MNRRNVIAMIGTAAAGVGVGVASTGLKAPEPTDGSRLGLTASERDDPLATYFDRPPAAVAADVQRALRGGPLPPEQALSRAAIAELDRPGYLAAETGYCTLPDGRGYVAVRTEMPEVTAEMIDWWFSWVNRADLRYKIWFPGLHYANHVTAPSEADAARLASYPASERKPYWFSTAHPLEDVGFGPEAIALRFVPPHDYGLGNPDFVSGKATAICTFVGADSVGMTHSQMCHYVRPWRGGVELRSRFWMGENVQLPGAAGTVLAPLLNSDFVRRRMIHPNRPFDMAQHCAQEYANLAGILPRLFERYAS
jgi:hypothetical protein